MARNLAHDSRLAQMWPPLLDEVILVIVTFARPRRLAALEALGQVSNDLRNACVRLLRQEVVALDGRLLEEVGRIEAWQPALAEAASSLSRRDELETALFGWMRDAHLSLRDAQGALIAESSAVGHVVLWGVNEDVFASCHNTAIANVERRFPNGLPAAETASSWMCVSFSLPALAIFAGLAATFEDYLLIGERAEEVARNTGRAVRDYGDDYQLTVQDLVDYYGEDAPYLQPLPPVYPQQVHIALRLGDGANEVRLPLQTIDSAGGLGRAPPIQESGARVVAACTMGPSWAMDHDGFSIGEWAMLLTDHSDG